MHRGSVPGLYFCKTLMRTAASLAWRTTLLQYLALLKATLPSQCQELPGPQTSPAAWETLWTTYPIQWSSLVAKFGVRRVRPNCQTAPLLSMTAQDTRWPFQICLPCLRLYGNISPGRPRSRADTKHASHSAAGVVAASTVCPLLCPRV